MSLDVSLVLGTREVFTRNITHNLGKMADAVNCYGVVWRPEENDIYFAEQLIDIIADSLIELKKDPDKYRKLEPSNRWGTYEGFIEFLESYQEACIKYPMANVEADR